MYFVALLLVLLGRATMYILDPTLGSKHARPMPWVGLLKYQEESKSNEGVASVVLINYEAAIVNSREVASIDKKRLRASAKVMFLRPDNTDWYCRIKDSILHPEFDTDTLNTIALLMLDCKDKFQMEHLIWPTDTTEVEDIFAVGFTDSRGVLEQTAYQMETVNSTDCLEFYSREEMDYKWIIPTHYRCYRSTYHYDQCVFDSGMTLVTNSSGKWTLIGISVWGPGCGLPSRFIDIEYYVPWIQEHTSVLRRIWRYNTFEDHKKMYLSEDGPTKNLDKYILERINDTQMVLRPFDGVREVVKGNCSYLDGELQYREDGTFEVLKDWVGMGIYGLSLYDLNYGNITCLSVTVTCTQRSITKFWVTKGFEQQDFMKEYIKTVPIKLHRDHLPPPRVEAVTERWIKYDLIDVTHLMFRFEFYKRATIKILFYANYSDTAEVTTSPAPMKTTRRTQRPHRTYIRQHGWNLTVKPEIKPSTTKTTTTTTMTTSKTRRTKTTTTKPTPPAIPPEMKTSQLWAYLWNVLWPNMWSEMFDTSNSSLRVSTVLI